MYFARSNELGNGKKPWTDFTKLNQLHSLRIRQHHRVVGRLGIPNEVAYRCTGLCQLLALWFRSLFSLLNPSVLITEHNVAEKIREIMTAKHVTMLVRSLPMQCLRAQALHTQTRIQILFTWDDFSKLFGIHFHLAK